MSLRRFVRLTFTAFSCLVLLPLPGQAQSTSATIRGIVKDDTGGLPGASIVSKEATGGFTFDATTGGEGAFTLAGLRRRSPTRASTCASTRSSPWEQAGVWS